MEPDSSKKLSEYLRTSHRDLDSVFIKVKELNLLNRQHALYLDPAMREYCQVANLTKDCLIVLVTSGSIAMRLQFTASDILKNLQKDFSSLKDVKTIQYKVRPSQGKPYAQEAVQQKIPRLSEKSAKAIREIADSIKDPALQAVMRRLALRIK
jgi:hypothetical protein